LIQTDEKLEEHLNVRKIEKNGRNFGKESKGMSLNRRGGYCRVGGQP